MSNLTTPVRIALIRAAIERVKEHRECYRQASVDPSTDAIWRVATKDSFTAAIKEFGWQYDNIEAVLDALAPVEKLQ